VAIVQDLGVMVSFGGSRRLPSLVVSRRVW